MLIFSWRIQAVKARDEAAQKGIKCWEKRDLYQKQSQRVENCYSRIRQTIMQTFQEVAVLGEKIHWPREQEENRGTQNKILEGTF